MEFKEAMAGIIDALGDRVSDFDEHLGVIKDAVTPLSGVNEWEQKYNDLHAKYVNRFKESFGGNFNATDDREGDYALDDATDGSPAVTLDMIDFNGDSE